MPGENCCVVGCGVSRRQKDIGIFKILYVKHAEWQKKIGLVPLPNQEQWTQTS